MFDSRKQNPSCNFAEEIVSYVYDEMAENDKANFEQHLVNCSPCADEVADFSSISFSIQEWRDTEFANLATPSIEIPYETKNEAVQTVETTNVSKSWIQSLRDAFTISPAFIKTATAFGALAIVVGLGWFLMSSFSNGNNNVAKDDKAQPKKESISSPNSIENNQIEEQIVVENKENVDQEIPNEIVEPSKEIADKTTIKKPKVNKSVKPVAPKTINRKPIIAKRNPKPKSKKGIELPKKNKLNDLELQQAPRLSEEFAIEDTDEKDLRLTDLLDDVGSDK